MEWDSSPYFIYFYTKYLILCGSNIIRNLSYKNELQKDKKKHFFVNHKNIFSWNTTDLVLWEFMKNNWFFFLYDLTWRPNLCSGNYQNKDSHTMNKIMMCYLIINISNVEKITRKNKMRIISSHLILYFRIYT